MQWGFNAWQAKPLFKAGAKVGTAKVQLGSSSEVPLVAPRDLAVTVPAGVLVQDRRDEDPLPGPGQGADRQGPACRRPGRHHRRHAAAGHAAGRRRGVGQAGFFGRVWIGLKQLFGMA